LGFESVRHIHEGENGKKTMFMRAGWGAGWLSVILFFTLLYHTLLYFVKGFILVGLKNEPFFPLFLHPVLVHVFHFFPE